MKQKMSKMKILSWAVFVIVCALFVLAILPLLASYNDPDKLLEYIGRFGMWGAFVLLIVQIVQIIIAIIPGELTEFVSGTLYGTFFGMLICLIGVFIGQLLIFLLVKWLGEKFSWEFVSKREFKKLKFLNDEKKLELTIFLLYFIPGTPKDALTYFVPMTKITLKQFLLLSCVARIPSILSSAYAGATFAEGDFIKTLLIYLVIGVISVSGLLVHRKFFNKGEKNGR